MRRRAVDEEAREIHTQSIEQNSGAKNLKHGARATPGFPVTQTGVDSLAEFPDSIWKLK